MVAGGRPFCFNQMYFVLFFPTSISPKSDLKALDKLYCLFSVFFLEKNVYFMRLSFAFSPCPNDTFMFEPIVNNRIDLEGLEFDFVLKDVEKLNLASLNLGPDITKISFNAFTKLLDDYQLLNSGSAIGSKCGPLLISRKTITLEDINNWKIAIPGIHTTAYLLLKFAFPNLHNFKEMIFSDIEDSVLNGHCEAGVIIHENRFTYHLKGLNKITDLGEFWENKTGSPIPLGGIVIKKNIDKSIKEKVDRIITRSVNYAMSHPSSGMEFVRSHAQEMDEKIIMSHIELYVNNFSKDLGSEGKNAVKNLIKFVKPDISATSLLNLFV